jgi:hypothetical protein
MSLDQEFRSSPSLGGLNDRGDVAMMDEDLVEKMSDEWQQQGNGGDTIV